MENRPDTSKTLSLISHIHSRAEEYLRAELKKKGLPNLSSSHGFILYNLAVNERLSMSEIAAKINRDKSTATALVQKLSEMGFVEKSAGEKDSRVKFVRLSEKGRRFTSCTSEISSALIRRCYHGFSESDAQNLTKYLLMVAANFDETPL